MFYVKRVGRSWSVFNKAGVLQEGGFLDHSAAIQCAEECSRDARDLEQSKKFDALDEYYSKIDRASKEHGIEIKRPVLSDGGEVSA